MVSMMLPSVLGEALEELAFELPRSAIELSMNDAIIDCADAALVALGAPVDEPAGELEELALLPVRALSRL
jgi:hypothetical protein